MHSERVRIDHASSFVNKTEKTKSEASSIEKMQLWHDELVKDAERELKTIAPSLKNVVEHITTDQPDYVIFLDKSARVFASPVHTYLQKYKLSNIPIFGFYNDDAIKARYLNNQPLDIATRDLVYLKGKKAFFIDETFSTGKGACALKKAMDAIGGEMFYFALTKDPKPQDFQDKTTHEYPLSVEEHQRLLKEIESSNRFIIYNNAVQNLFSRRVARLYIEEKDSKTVSKFVTKKASFESEEIFSPRRSIPSANDYVTYPKGMTKQEYEAKVKNLNYTTVRIIKNKILEVLESDPANLHNL